MTTGEGEALTETEWRVFWRAVREWNDASDTIAADDPSNAILRDAVNRILADRRAAGGDK